MHKLLIFLSILNAIALSATETTWDLIKTKHGVSAYKKHLPNEGLYAFKGEGFIDHPIDKVLTVLLDNNRATEWVPKLSECKIVKSESWPQSFSQLSLFDAPWPIKDRYFYSKVSVEINKNNIDIFYHNLDLQPPLTEDKKRNAIQGSIAGSHYRLIQSPDDNRTFFIATSVVRPYGKIPQWLINWAGSSMPFDTVKRLNKQLQKPDINVPGSVKTFMATRLKKAK